MTTVTIKPERVVYWMNVIRSYQHDSSKQYRILENFWESQIKSKVWLMENIEKFNNKFFPEIYIFGGWYGILAQLLADKYPDKKIFSIDQDPECAIIGSELCNRDPKITFITEKMENFTNYTKFPLVINTSVEHLTEDIFNTWLDNIPEKASVVLQGNNFFDCPEHVRCVKSLEEFEAIAKLNSLFMTGTLDCSQFSRFMLIGSK
jgi:trans-aconitate methyltransferase